MEDKSENTSIVSIFQENLTREQEKLTSSYNHIVMAFVESMADFIMQNDSMTYRGLKQDIEQASTEMMKYLCSSKTVKRVSSFMPVKALSVILLNLYNKFVSKHPKAEIEVIKDSLVTVSNDFVTVIECSRDKIFKFFNLSAKNGITFLLHGYSSSLEHCLVQLKRAGFMFTVIVTEGGREESGKRMEEVLSKEEISHKVVPDTAVGFYMDSIDTVLLKASAVVESGGIISQMGAFSTCICAKYYEKPVHVVTESYRFYRKFPLHNKDLPDMSEFIEDEEQLVEYVPPEFITLLFTDIGILTPSSVSDELIQMFST